MKEFPLEDYIPEEKTQAKPVKKRPESQKTRGQEVMRAIELFDISVRELHRPLDREEARKLEAVINEMDNCSLQNDDTVIIHKILDIITREHHISISALGSPHAEDKRPRTTLLGSRSNPLEIAFKLGMAYERVETGNTS